MVFLGVRTVIYKVADISRAKIQDLGDGIRVAVLSDPFGNDFGVIQNPHFKVA